MFTDVVGGGSGEPLREGRGPLVNPAELPLPRAELHPPPGEVDPGYSALGGVGLARPDPNRCTPAGGRPAHAAPAVAIVVAAATGAPVIAATVVATVAVADIDSAVHPHPYSWIDRSCLVWPGAISFY